METSIIDSKEAGRMRSLEALHILDTDLEKEYSDLVELAALVTETPLSAISLVDSDRLWLKARVGVPMQEIPRDKAFCSYAIKENKPFIVENAAIDERFKDSALVVHGDIRFYAGVPIYYDETHLLGTLCVLDQKEQKLPQKKIEALVKISKALNSLLQLRYNNLLMARQQAELNNNFFRLQALSEHNQELGAMLVHDLRSPITVISGACKLLGMNTGADETSELLGLVEASTKRLQELVDYFLDKNNFEDLRSQLKLGEVDLQSFFNDFVEINSLKGGFNAQIRLFMHCKAKVEMDANIMLRVFDNIVSNAHKYAGKSDKFLIDVYSNEETVLVKFSDQGEGVADVNKAKVFDKGFTLASQQLQASEAGKSYGLGLAFCRKAVEAHLGTIWIEDNKPCGASFCIKLPLKQKQIVSKSIENA